jgi:kynurenine formamidase
VPDTQLDELPTLKEIVDLSMPLKSLDTPVFPGAPQPLRATIQTNKVDGYLSFLWAFSEHTSTHTDAPIHMVEGGETIDRIPLHHYVASGVVADISDKPKQHQITGGEVRGALDRAGFKDGDGKGRILLLRTGFSEKSRTPDWLMYPDLTKDACDFIISKGFEAVGMDSPSPDRPPFTAHKTLLPKNVMVFENLANLDRVMGKKFYFVGAPLFLVGGSASPVRAVALVF